MSREVILDVFCYFNICVSDSRTAGDSHPRLCRQRGMRNCSNTAYHKVTQSLILQLCEGRRAIRAHYRIWSKMIEEQIPDSAVPLLWQPICNRVSAKNDAALYVDTQNCRNLSSFIWSLSWKHLFHGQRKRLADKLICLILSNVLTYLTHSYKMLCFHWITAFQRKTVKMEMLLAGRTSGRHAACPCLAKLKLQPPSQICLLFIFLSIRTDCFLQGEGIETQDTCLYNVKALLADILFTVCWLMGQTALYSIWLQNLYYFSALRETSS